MPATSSKVTRPVFSVISRARDLPKPMALPPPDCIWRMKKIHTPIKSSMGNQEIRMLKRPGVLSSAGKALMRTPRSLSLAIRVGSSGE